MSFTQAKAASFSMSFAAGARLTTRPMTNRARPVRFSVAASSPIVASDAIRWVWWGRVPSQITATGVDPGSPAPISRSAIFELAPGNWTDCLTQVLISPTGERTDKQ